MLPLLLATNLGKLKDITVAGIEFRHRHDLNVGGIFEQRLPRMLS